MPYLRPISHLPERSGLAPPPQLMLTESYRQILSLLAENDELRWQLSEERAARREEVELTAAGGEEAAAKTAALEAELAALRGRNEQLELGLVRALDAAVDMVNGTLT